MNKAQPINEGTAIAEAGAINTDGSHNYEHLLEYTSSRLVGPIPRPSVGSLLNNYLRLPSWPIIMRSFEPPMELFMFQFKPFNKTYKPHYDFMDQLRKKIGKHEVVIITREINAAKVHYNALVISKTLKAEKFHDKQTNNHKIYCVKCPMADKYKVHNYITKESKVRYFYDTKKNWHKQDIYTK